MLHGKGKRIAASEDWQRQSSNCRKQLSIPRTACERGSLPSGCLFSGNHYMLQGRRNDLKVRAIPTIEQADVD